MTEVKKTDETSVQVPRKRQCWGLNRNWKRCHNQVTKLKRLPFCHEHRRQPVKWLVSILLAMVSPGLVLGIWSVYQGIESSRDMAQLRNELLRVRDNLVDRLIATYPLGFCLVGIHGSQILAIPSQQDTPFEVDWAGIRLHRLTEQNATIIVPRIKWREGENVTVTHLYVDLPRGGGEMPFQFCPLGIAGFDMIATHIRTTPSGECFVIGIRRGSGHGKPGEDSLNSKPK
jgi:hypothetical protein